MRQTPEPPTRSPLVGRRRWIRREGYVLGGSKRKTKRREQRAVRQSEEPR